MRSPYLSLLLEELTERVGEIGRPGRPKTLADAVHSAAWAVAWGVVHEGLALAVWEDAGGELLELAYFAELDRRAGIPLDLRDRHADHRRQPSGSAAERPLKIPKDPT